MSAATVAVLRAEARLFWRERAALFWILLFPTLLLAALGLAPGFREDDPELGGRSMLDLYVPVSILLSMIMAGVMTMPTAVTAYRETGVLRRLRTTPVSPLALLLAQAVLHAAAVAASSLLVIVVARFVFGSPLPRSPWGYLAAYVVALAVALALGAAITAASPDARVGQVITMVVFFPSMFTAGVYVPVEVFTGPLHTIVSLTPFGAASNAFNDAVAGDLPPLADLAVMAGWTLALAALAVHTFRWE